MSNIALTKTSNPSDIERYFRGILELDKQNKEFSVNLDDVWQIAYERKDNAVRGLKTNFIENVDFIVIRNNAENSGVGRPTDDYYLTSACLEYFVARKVRPVFEVYRRVFHKVASGEMTEIEKTQQKIIYANWVVGFLNLNEASKLRIAQEIGKYTGRPVCFHKVLTPARMLLRSTQRKTFLRKTTFLSPPSHSTES